MAWVRADWKRGSAATVAQQGKRAGAFENRSRTESHETNRSRFALSRARFRRLSCANERLFPGSREIFLLWNSSFRSHGRAADLATNRGNSERRCRVRGGTDVFAANQSFPGSHVFIRT